MRIAVLGATGVAGRALIPALKSRGHQVRASFHSAGGQSTAAQLGDEAMRCDILDPGSVNDFTAGSDAVINLATAIPKPGGTGSWVANDRVRRDGTANVITACKRCGSRLIQQSVAMLHCANDVVPQAENDPLVGYGVLESASELERMVSAASIDWRIVRGAAFYGPGTGREQALVASVSDPAFRVPGDGSAWISFVHVRDFAAALCVIVEDGRGGEAYIAADDSPIQMLDLYSRLAAGRRLSMPLCGGPAGLRSFRVSNAKLRGIGWRPTHPLLSLLDADREEAAALANILEG